MTALLARGVKSFEFAFGTLLSGLTLTISAFVLFGKDSQAAIGIPMVIFGLISLVGGCARLVAMTDG